MPTGPTTTWCRAEAGAPRRRAPNLAPYEVFACADGYMILAIGNDSQFAGILQANGPGLAPGAGIRHQRRQAHACRQLRPLLREQLAAWQMADSGQALDAVGISWGNVDDLEQVSTSQVRHRQMLQTVQHPQLGPLELVRNPMVQPGQVEAITPSRYSGLRPCPRPITTHNRRHEVEKDDGHGWCLCAATAPAAWAAGYPSARAPLVVPYAVGGAAA